MRADIPSAFVFTVPANNASSGSGGVADSAEVNKNSASAQSSSKEDTRGDSPEFQIDLVALQSAYKEDEAVRAIIDLFSRRERNQKTTKLDLLIRQLSTADFSPSRTATIHALRRLEDAGVGSFIAGRKGKPTRFRWRSKSVEIRGLADDSYRETP
jgi:hypothetical protein